LISRISPAWPTRIAGHRRPDQQRSSAESENEVIRDVPIDVAINEYKAMALFGEKYWRPRSGYQDRRFLDGTLRGHAYRGTGEIGLIKVLKEGSVSSGIRRIEAVTGEGSLRHSNKIISWKMSYRAFGRSHPFAKNAKGWGTLIREFLSSSKL